ncbi:hypothetical protein [Vibrio owensii]|uniref:PFGI-1 class ICE element type IV pilus protein PilL2 n=1 Tax=Vibrio owensii TaxID=696485 RepID=UPI0018F15EAC|nr:hypothetical protein [Vibrio owensii]
MPRVIGVLALMAMTFAVGASAKDVQLEKRMSGYTKVLVDTKVEQKDPLNKVVTFTFPSGVQNVGQALNYTLNATGYRVVDLDELSPDVLRLFTMKLPEVNYGFNHASVRQVLNVLVGDQYQVEVDGVRRVVLVGRK